MDHRKQFEEVLASPAPMLALAPMQEVTDLPFLRLMAAYGGADVYFTEYFRVYATSRLDKHILKSITENPTGRPVIAQMIGNDIPALVRTARELQAVSGGGGGPEPGLPRAGRLSQGRGRWPAARTEAGGRHSRRAAGRGENPVHRQDPPRLRLGGGLRRTAADLREALTRLAHRARPDGEGDVSQRGALRIHRARRRRAALPRAG